VESVEQVSTRLAPFARVPGILPGVWAALVMLGIAIALALQFLVIAVDHLVIGPWWVISTFAIVGGMVGAKGWYIVLHRHEHRINGWCIQGFITSATLMAATLLVVFRIPARVFLDVTAPGLLIAIAVGRLGCFFGGCCGGPLTASRFGVWSSDQCVGARRVPTQLLESALARILGLLVLVAVLNRGPVGGDFFLAGLSAYTLGRQGILHLRAEPRKTKWGGLVTAILVALVLVAAVVLLIW
jgi:phosphatidylglycerol:prolipoprotein diacylglycerol transferase